MPVEKKLTDTEALNILKEYFDGSSHTLLVEKYGVSKKTVYNIIYLKSYGEILIPFVKNKFNGSMVDYFLAVAQRRVQGLQKKL